jgi:hypothetical protein
MIEGEISVKEIGDLEAQAASLGLELPTTISIFPHNFEKVDNINDLEFREDDQTVRKLLKHAGIPLTDLEIPQRKYLHLHDNLPVICLFLSCTYLTQDPLSIQLALSVVGNYLTDLCKGHKNPAHQRCTVTVKRENHDEKKRSFEEITYSGPVSGISKLAEHVINGRK